MARRAQPEPNPVPIASASFENAFAVAQQLAADFQACECDFLSPNYQESEVRKDFIDKFLIALGWDVNHDRQKNPYQQEAKVERGVSASGSQRRADYAFHLSPNFHDVRFYVEAKKPFGELASSDNCFQAIRYGWSAQTPVVVLTNFFNFVILDSRYMPDIDTATSRVLKRFHYSDYANEEKFAEIYYLFSHEALAANSLEQYAATLPKRRGKSIQPGFTRGAYQSIDESFLLELDDYRERLARAFKRKNPELDGETLTEITQRVIDRLVFIRFLEDKMIQPQHLISEFGDKGTAWQDFVAASRKLDAFCNGVVFKKHAIIDSPSFMVDDRDFADICKRLAYVNSPYDFNAIPIHILGSIYERFLGKVITATAKRATVEEKPEVRKAGGVYYTPEYIVRYIVENTVGTLIEGKTPAQIAEMRFADIACGSGSFLLGVFDVLLRYHGQWYNSRPAQAKKDGCELRDDGAWHLSLNQRRQILLNNIYGVDIDRQAVEVAQLSLYLKLLEDETTATARNYQLEMHETLLPQLDKNIICGNSLIGTDILEGFLFEPDEEKTLNPMDFRDRFPEVGKRGGFDAIVGNPPYLLLQPQNVDEPELKYFQSHFKVSQYKIDIFHLFIERALTVISEKGFLGFITPASFLTNNGTVRLRSEILEKTRISNILVLPDGVFRDASVDNVVFTLQKESSSAVRAENIFPFLLAKAGNNIFQVYDRMIASQQDLHDNTGLIFRPPRTPAFKNIASKMSRNSVKLGQVSRINFGMQLRDRSKYPNDVLVNPPLSKISLKYRKCLGGSDVQFYETTYSGLYCLCDRKAQRGGCWDESIQFAKRKVLVRQIGKFPMATLETDGLCCLNALFMIKSLSDDYDEAYFLGLINSRLFRFYWINKYYDFKDTFPKIKGTYLEELPIRRIDLRKPSDKAFHDRIVALVDQMLSAKKQLAKAKSDSDKDFYGNKCSTIGRQIDALVYELYSLTPEEIATVEDSQS